MHRHKVGFPRMGKYTKAFAQLVKELGMEPVIPSEITQDTIKLGVRHSSDMVCFPFKSTLGILIQSLDMGADILICPGINPNEKMQETCRFGFYYHIQSDILKRLGYKFEMVYLQGGILSIIRTLSQVSGVSLLKAGRVVYRFYKRIKKIEEQEFYYEPKDVNIGLVGEVYTLWENDINYNIIHKLRKMEIGVHVSITFTQYLAHRYKVKHHKAYLKALKKYIPKRVGAHGTETLYYTKQYAEQGFDGVIHLLPLSCMPETLVEMVMNHISEDYGIPIYRFPFDENRFEVGFDTRLETFCKLLRRKKHGTIMAGN